MSKGINKIFISGSRRISRLNKDILDFVMDIINKEAHIIVGDANGVDKAVQRVLADINYKNVTVYFSGSSPRNNLGGWRERSVKTSARKNSFEFYSAKDKKMALECDMGLAVWDGKSRGTVENILNILKMNKEVTLYYYPEKRFIKLGKLEDARWLIEHFNRYRRKDKISLPITSSEVMQEQTSFKFEEKS
jgi:adenine-specific DNA-methyltransferase